MILKNPVGRIIRSKVQNLTRVFSCLLDSNFRPARINSELISWRIVYHTDTVSVVPRRPPAILRVYMLGRGTNTARSRFGQHPQDPDDWGAVELCHETKERPKATNVQIERVENQAFVMLEELSG